MARSHLPRLRQIPDFFSRARKLNSQHFVCYYLFSQEFSRLQITTIAPSSTFTTLVKRNAYKRQVKEIVRNYWRQKNTSDQAGMIVIYVKKITQGKQSFSQMEAEIISLLNQILP